MNVTQWLYSTVMALRHVDMTLPSVYIYNKARKLCNLEVNPGIEKLHSNFGRSILMIGSFIGFFSKITR